MNLQISLDPVTAIQVAEYFEKNGHVDTADQFWSAINHMTANDRELRAHFGNIIFDSRQSRHELGTIERSRFLLYLMAIAYPTPKLVAAYFDNLQRMFRGRTRLKQPGKVVLGMGSGRCGSSTLSAAFSLLPDACATHETPPHVFWEPTEEQARFHLDRLRLLTDYFPLVFDAAHWWLNLSPRVFSEFPNAKVIGLIRETEPCARSFLKHHDQGSDVINHWAPPENGVWRTHLWDPAYPKYEMPANLAPQSEEALQAKIAMITRYVTEYNQSLRALQSPQPQRVLLIRTEALNDPQTATQMRELVGVDVSMPAKSLNVGNDTEGSHQKFWF